MKNPRNIIKGYGTDRVYSRVKILFVLLLQLAMALMAVSSINVALPSIEAGLGATDSDLQWVLSGYALTFGITLVPAGRAGDLLGRGSFFVLGVGLFALASLAAGLAPNPEVLNLARLVQGVGAGISSPQTTGIITQYFSGGGRAKAFALFGLVVSASVAVGPLLTGVIIQWFGSPGWRFSFLLNFPLGVLAVVLGLVWFPFNSERKRKADRKAGVAEHLKVDLDPVGATMLCLAVLCVMLPFMVKTGPSFLLLIVAAALVVGWLKWEERYKDRGGAPIVDLVLFEYRNFSYQTIISGSMFLGSTSIFALLAIYLQSGLHIDALSTGLIGLPNALASALFSVLAGRRVMRQGHSLVVGALASMVLGIVSSMLMVLLIADQGLSYWWLALPLVLIGIGHGTMASANQTLSMADIPPSAGGTAGGIKQTGERISTAVGNAMLTGVLFALVPILGWTAAFNTAFAVTALIISISLAVAIKDRRDQGPGLHRELVAP